LSKVKSLRETMPVVSAFVDELREAFGAVEINTQIRAGMAGEGTFWASESGVEVGSKPRQIPPRLQSGSGR